MLTFPFFIKKGEESLSWTRSKSTNKFKSYDEIKIYFILYSLIHVYFCVLTFQHVFGRVDTEETRDASNLSLSFHFYIDFWKLKSEVMRYR